MQFILRALYHYHCNYSVHYLECGGPERTFPTTAVVTIIHKSLSLSLLFKYAFGKWVFDHLLDTSVRQTDSCSSK